MTEEIIAGFVLYTLLYSFNKTGVARLSFCFPPL